MSSLEWYDCRDETLASLRIQGDKCIGSTRPSSACPAKTFRFLADKSVVDDQFFIIVINISMSARLMAMDLESFSRGIADPGG